MVLKKDRNEQRKQCGVHTNGDKTRPADELLLNTASNGQQCLQYFPSAYFPVYHPIEPNSIFTHYKVRKQTDRALWLRKIRSME
mmetsp:Transcript_741/g.1575  ORF Transcript_741/g.1575 Transcript_741/m.1575 type:complete len:84 (-) Transcript_741:900-1151(-)